MSPFTLRLYTRESLPLTPRLSLCARADGWDREKNKMTKNDFGVWEVVVKATKKGELAIPHNSKIKVSLGRTRAGLRSHCGGGADAKK